MESVDKSYQLMACHYIDSQLKKLSNEIDGARKGRDIECVHQSRVASRRLRAAFGIFEDCFPVKKIKKWRKEIKILTKTFGPARDTDVQIEYLNKVLSNLDADKKTLLPGIKRLLLRTSQRREKLQRRIVKTIDRLESGAVLAEIHSNIEKSLFCIPYCDSSAGAQVQQLIDRDKQNKDLDFKNEYIFRNTSKHIHVRLQELLSCQKYLENADDKAGHHRMRIAAKRLRYTMEICQEPYEGKLDSIIKIVKKLQMLLGEIHDCDAWIDHINQFMQEELQRTIEYYGNEKPYYLLHGGLEYLQQQRRQEREHLFGILVRYWERLNRQNFWKNLELILRETIADPLDGQTTRRQTNNSMFKIVEIRNRTSRETPIKKNTVDR